MSLERRTLLCPCCLQRYSPQKSACCRNVPDLEDIAVTVRLLRSLGADVQFSENSIRVRAREISQTEAPYSLVKKLRASFWVLGPLLARVGRAEVALPGGDAIGTRPVDLHIKGLMEMGADVRMRHGVVVATAPGGLHPATIELQYPSVGATHNLMMAAALVEGTTVLRGAAREPEIVALGNFLRSIGVGVEDAVGQDLVIHGSEKLKGGTFSVLGDRIEAATYLVAGAMTQGDVTVKGIAPGFLEAMLGLLEQAGCDVVRGTDQIRVSSERRLSPIHFETAPFPGVATDVQPLLMAALTTAAGESKIFETVFDNRFGHVAEYRRLGAEIVVEGNTARVIGVPTLSGAPVEAMDIRAAAGLVLLGLVADGLTEILEIHHLDRGYENLIMKFQALGANIRRVPTQESRELVVGC